jgi:uncharacterized protein (DUF4415 family)
MASSKIVKYTSEELEEKRRRGESKTDWERVRKMKDEEIDYTDSPELDDSFFKRAVVAMPVPKKPITIRVEPEVLQWFRSKGPRYQTRINAVLKAYVQARKKAS